MNLLCSTFKVKYSGTRSYDNKFKHGGTKDAGKSTTFTVVGLVPGSNYKFEVYGTSVCGESLAIVLNEETKIAGEHSVEALVSILLVTLSQYFSTLQLILNPLAPQVAVLIEAGQDNQ